MGRRARYPLPPDCTVGLVLLVLAPNAIAAGIGMLLAGATAQDLAELGVELRTGESIWIRRRLAVNWPNVQTPLCPVPDWSHRVLVDATNRVAGCDPFTPGDLGWAVRGQPAAA